MIKPFSHYFTVFACLCLLVAGVDVFAAEPLSENSLLWQLDNVLITPHISAVSPQYLELFVKELAGRIKSI